MLQHVIDTMTSPKVEFQDLVMQLLESKGTSDEATVSPGFDSVVIKSMMEKNLKAIKHKVQGILVRVHERKLVLDSSL